MFKLKPKMTIGMFYDIIDQYADDDTPLAFYSKKFPEYYIDGTTPCYITYSSCQIPFIDKYPQVGLFINYDANNGQILYKDDLLSILEEAAAENNWDSALDVSIPSSSPDTTYSCALGAKKARWTVRCDDNEKNVFWFPDHDDGRLTSYDAAPSF